MLELNLPPFEKKITQKDGNPFILDVIRRQYVALTPEEWVRRNTIEWLVQHRATPELRISQEYPVNVNRQHQRADILVIDERAKPYLLVECKAPDVTIDNEVVMQAMRYNAVVGARYILLTNGIKIYCYEYCNGQYRPARTF